MKILRREETEITANNFKIGDQIEVELKDFGTFTATAHEVKENATLLVFDDCICEKPMNESGTNEGGFTESDLHKWLNDTLIEAFPDKLIKNMVQFENGDYLTIPSYGQMFGHDDFYREYVEADKDDQLPLMQVRENRICSFKNDWCWYWLKNAYKNSGSDFCGVYIIGGANSSTASDSAGVRPAFLIKK